MKKGDCLYIPAELIHYFEGWEGQLAISATMFFGNLFDSKSRCDKSPSGMVTVHVAGMIRAPVAW